MRKIKITVLLLSVLFILCGCDKQVSIPDKALEIDGLNFSERVELKYADKFAIDRYNDGYSLISTADGNKYLLVPENADVPEVDGNIKIIQKPVENIYLAATAVMDLFDSLGKGDAIAFSSTKNENWYIDYAKTAMENGDMVYAGKYNEPDYELLLSEGCNLTIQSTMIGHAPDVREKLEELGMTVFIDNSSYESHPLGRSEWIKVYAEMLDESEKAEKLFDEQAKYLENIKTNDGDKKSVVFFYISDSGQIVTRKPGDYVTKMIELAGGENILSDLGDDSATSTVHMEPEEFYTSAKDADLIIYNSTISGELNSMDELLSKYALLSDFKAVKNGDVWCTRNNLFQETMKLGAVISDFNKALTGNEDTVYLYKLEGEK